MENPRSVRGLRASERRRRGRRRSTAPPPPRRRQFATQSAARDAEASRAEAAARLGALLRRSTIRTLKSDIRLPPLVREVTPLSFTRAHAKSYNELVSFLRRGLLLADWADPSHEESLLNPRRARLATEAVANLREAACVTGEFPVTCFAEEIDETVSDLVAALTARGASRDVAVARAEELRYPLTNHRGTCARCRADSFLPMLTPCGHLLCSGCVAVVGDEDKRGVSGDGRRISFTSNARRDDAPCARRRTSCRRRIRAPITPPRDRLCRRISSRFSRRTCSTRGA